MRVALQPESNGRAQVSTRLVAALSSPHHSGKRLKQGDRPSTKPSRRRNLSADPKRAGLSRTQALKSITPCALDSRFLHKFSILLVFYVRRFSDYVIPSPKKDHSKSAERAVFFGDDSEDTDGDESMNPSLPPAPPPSRCTSGTNLHSMADEAPAKGRPPSKRAVLAEQQRRREIAEFGRRLLCIALTT